MASGTPLPQYQDVKTSAAAMLWQVYHQRPRTQRAKVLALSIGSFLLFLFMVRVVLRVSSRPILLSRRGWPSRN